MKTADAVVDLKFSMGEVVLNEVQFLGETTLEVKKERLKDVLAFFIQSGFEVLMDLTAVDYLQPEPKTKLLYWLHNPTNYERVRVILYAAREESIPSVVELWEGANWYEREVYDLFGVTFEGHPDLTRLLMPDDWSGHPLRRDYPLTEKPVEFKGGIFPKIPSEIINTRQSGKNISQLKSNDKTS